jgi:PiT family inorganic phosphate transporter
MEIALFLLVLFAGLYMAWNIGANDVANAMGTSVGSNALTLRQAIVIAAVLEFSGAFFFGSHVSETLQSGLIKAGLFMDKPQVLLLGMISSLIGTGLWLHLASYFGWPVSTTHTIVGSIIGFGLLVGGPEAVNFFYVASVFSSWIFSPIAGGVLGYLLFQLIRTRIFHAPQPLAAALTCLPYFTGVVAVILSAFLIFEVLPEWTVSWEWRPFLFLFCLEPPLSLSQSLLHGE